MELRRIAAGSLDIIVIISAVALIFGLFGPSADCSSLPRRSSNQPPTNGSQSQERQPGNANGKKPPPAANQPVIFHYTSQLVEIVNLTQTEKENIINLKDEPFLVSKNLSLFRCSLYRFTYKIYDRNQLKSVTKIIRTPNADPNSKIGQTYPFGTSIELIWNTDYPECVDYYSLTVKDLSQHRTRTISIAKDASSHEIIGLIPCTDYSLTLKTFSTRKDRRAREHRATIAERTSLANIDLEYFEYSILDNSSILFNWTQLSQVERCDGDYFVKLVPLDDPFSIAIETHVPYTINFVVVDEAKACQKYNVSLNANYFDVVASLGEISGPFATPSNIYGLQFNSDQLRLEWSTPRENPNCVANYTVTVEEVGSFLATLTELQLDYLPRCVTRNVSVQMTDVEGNQFPPEEIQVKLTQDVLQVTFEPKISVKKRQAVISWTPPLRENCGIIYESYWNSRLETGFQANNTIAVNDFQYCVENSLSITMNFKGTSRTFNETIEYDGQTAPHIENLTYTFDEWGEVVNLTWDKPTGYENCEFTYILETDEFVVKVEDEFYSIPWEDHDISVSVSIKQDLNGRSSCKEITIRAPFPAVTNLKHTNLEDGRTKISWSKPDTSSKINKYVVIWDNKATETSDTSITDTFTKCTDNEILVYVKYNGQNSANVSYTFKYVVAPEAVENLKHTFEYPNYKLTWDASSTNVYCYKSFIITRSSNGDPSVIDGYEYLFSSWSDDEEYTFEVVAMYDDSHRSAAAKHVISTPGGVKNLTIKENEHGTADLEWAHPENADHIPESYLLDVNGANYTTRHSHITITVTYCVDLEIIVDVRYKTGVTKRSTFNRKLLKSPSAVENIEMSIHLNDPDTIFIKWDAPITDKDCANSYRLQLNGGSIIVHETQYEETKWEPCHALNLTIAALNTDGVAGPEKSESFQTPWASVSAVTDLDVYTTDKTLRAKWEEPDKGKFCVTGYRVVVWDVNTLNVIYDHENESMVLVLEDMKACRQLMLQVTPLTKNGDGLPIQMEGNMRERAPGTPSPVQSIDTQSRSLELQTTFDDEFYLCPLEEVKVTCVDSANCVTTEVKNLASLQPERNQTFKVVIDDLDPYESYTCFAVLKNIYGSTSSPSFNTTILTMEDIAEPPEDLFITHRAHNLVKFSWKDPTRPNGRITHYEVHVTEINPLYHVPERCEDHHNKLRINTTLVDKEYRVETVKAYTNYEFSVRAINGAGVGQEIKLLDQTDSYIPESPIVNFLGVSGPFNADEYDSSAKVSWQFPCAINGHFENFTIVLRGHRAQNLDEIKLEYSKIGIEDDYELDFKDLKPSYDYEVQTSIATSTFKITSPSVYFRAPASVPSYVAANEISLNMTLNPSQGAVLNISKRNLLDSGDILYYSVMISEMDCQSDPVAQRQVMNTTTQWPSVKSWSDVQSDDCQRQYQATPERYSLGLETVVDVDAKTDDSSDVIEILIGHENCDHPKDTRFCNGPLRSGTAYAVVLRVFTESGYTDNEFVIVETISEIKLTIVILMVITCLSSAFMAGLMIMLRKRNQELQKESLIEGPKKLSGAGDILTKNFPEHFDDLSKNNCERLNMEFNMINTGGLAQSTTTYTVAKSNGPKNRYTNVLPYDFNRVILEDDGDTDYINASFINGFRKPRDYIASQGPKMDSSYDFWRMIVQFKVSSVVMLTSYREGDKEKCHEYFPSNASETLQFSEITIKCQKEIDFETHKKRIFTIEKNNVSHTVYHYHFLKWPDHSCPNDPNDLIEFTRTISAERKHPANPMIVHCSAGVGRTGTFIALDIALQQMRAEKRINVLDIVKELRRQRMKMVQSFSQYLLLYQCIVIILKQNEEAQSEGVWKRLSKKTHLRSANGPRMKNFGIHNFGMLPTSPLKERGCAASPIPIDSPSARITAAADLQVAGTSRSSDFIENGPDDLHMKSIAPDNYEFVACFEPEDSIT